MVKKLLSETIGDLNRLSNETEKWTGQSFDLTRGKLVDKILVDKIDAIQTKIKSAIRSKKEIKDTIPRYIRRQWIRATLFLACRRIINAKKIVKVIARSNSFEKDFEKINKNFKLSSLSLAFALKMLDVQNIFQKTSTNGEIRNFLISKEKINKGDIILSYKTSEYLSSHPISSLIAFASDSHITHASIVCEPMAGSPRMITVKSSEKCLTTLDLEPEKGEVFVVLKIDNNFSKKNEVLSLIDDLASHVEKNTCLPDYCEYKFSEIKFWWACLIGFIDTNTIRFFGRTILWPDPVRKYSGIICSEMIENIFKKTGTTLCPRSTSNLIIGPVELFYSPYFDFKGIVCNKNDDLEIIQKEFSRI